MSDVYEWFDPHAVRQIAAAAPARISEARRQGQADGMAEVARLQGSMVWKAMEITSDQMGRMLVDHPNVVEAVKVVANGLRQNSEVRVSFEEDIRAMNKMVVQTVDVRPFRLNYGMRVSPEDMYARRF
jgi:hypothetical protein